MERCPNCGNKLSSIDVLCPKCGAVVEVIQTKTNPSSPETATDGNTQKPEPAPKKDIPKYFNVYYEGLPDEDSIDNEPEEAPKKEPEETPEEPEKPAASVQAEAVKQPNRFQAAIEEVAPEEYKKAKGSFSEIVTAKVNEPGDDDYSPRYLENLKNLDLPEIDDISNFDPEEYMREYKYKKILGGQAASEDSQSAKKQWLEIEETEPKSDLASELTKVREDLGRQEEQAPPAERRYRGIQDSRTEKKRDSRPERKQNVRPERKQVVRPEIIQDNRPEINQETVIGEEIPMPPKKKRSPRAAAMVLMWIVVSAAIFFGCIFLDNYIKTSYGSYGNFIKTITNGQVDLSPGNS